jgi:16S rRNA (uracil1498-N3)-methyltransferase
MMRLLHSISDPPPESISVEGERFHYLAHVLRVSSGDTLEIFDGKGRAFSARIRSVEASRVVLELGGPVITAPTPRITLVQGLPKATKMEWLIQKGTELGAAAFAPVAMRRSVLKIPPARAEARTQRWQTIAAEAARQSGRSDVPHVYPPRPLLDAAREVATSSHLLLLDERERALRLSEAVLSSPGTLPGWALIVGPEGGIEESEGEALRKLGATSVSMGPRVLRTETAGLAALSVLLHLAGELG